MNKTHQHDTHVPPHAANRPLELARKAEAEAGKTTKAAPVASTAGIEKVARAKPQATVPFS